MKIEVRFVGRRVGEYGNFEGNCINLNEKWLKRVIIWVNIKIRVIIVFGYVNFLKYYFM